MAKSDVFGKGHAQVPMHVSRGEEALYGEMAPALRYLQTMLGNAEDAQTEIVKLMEASREGDSLATGRTNFDAEREGFDSQGRSPHTQWLVSVFETVNALHRDVRQLYQELSFETQRRWMDDTREAEAVPAGTMTSGRVRASWTSSA